MFSPKSILIKNVGTHVSTYYEFEQNFSTLIFGINNDTPKIRSNGSGKSSFIEAIHIALTGKPIRNVTKDKIIRNGEDTGEIVFVLENKVTNTEIMLNWFLHRKKSWSCKVFINDTEKTDFTSVVDIPNWIMSQFDISKEDFKNYYLVSKSNYLSFFETSDTDKKGVISRFSSADIVDNTQSVLASKIDNIKKEISNSESEIAKLEGNREVLQEQLDAINNFDDDKEIGVLNDQIKELAVEISMCKVNLEKLKTTKSESEASLQKLEKNLEADRARRDKTTKEKDTVFNKIQEIEKSARTEIDNKYADEFQEIKELEKETTTKLKKLKTEIQDLEHEKAELNKLLAGEIVCPKCSTKFLLGEDEDPKELAEALVLTQEIIDKKTNKSAELNEIISELEKETVLLEEKVAKEKEKIAQKTKDLYLQQSEKLADLRAIETEITALLNEKQKLQQIYFGIESSIKTCNSTIDTNNAQIQQIEIKIQKIKSGEAKKAKEKELTEKIETIDKSILAIKESFAEKTGKIKNYTEWQISFKKFKSFLVNKTIKSINGYCNYYLELMKSDLRVVLEGYKTNKDGSVKETITTFIERNGESEGEYAKLSGGERTTIDISLILSVQRMINNASKTGGLDLLITDEIIESVDEVGVEDIIKSLDKISQTSLHVTHSPINLSVDHKLIFEKTNKQTKIYAN